MAGPSHDPSLYRDRDVVPVRRALVSVSDKTDLLRLAEALAARRCRDRLDRVDGRHDPRCRPRGDRRRRRSPASPSRSTAG